MTNSDKSDLIAQLIRAYVVDGTIEVVGPESRASYERIRNLESKLTEDERREAWRSYCERTR